MLKGLRKRLAIIFTAFTGAVLTVALGISFYQSTVQTRLSHDMWFSNATQLATTTVMSNATGGESAGIYEGEYIVCVKQNDELREDVLAEAEDATPVSRADRLAMFQLAKDTAGEEGMEDWAWQSSIIYPTAEIAEVSGDGVIYSVTGEAAPAEAGDEAGIEGNFRAVTEGSVAIAISPTVSTEGVFDMEYQGARYRATYFSWEVSETPTATPDVYEIAVMEPLAAQTREMVLDGLWYALIWLGGLALLFLVNWFLARLVLRPTEDGLRRQTEFVAAASHELRSPLAVIRSSLSAAAEAEDDAQAEKFQAAATEEADRMSHLVDDLLLLAGGDAGSWQLQTAPVDLDTLLIDAVEGYTPLAKAKGVKLALDLPEETLPRVQGDAERLRQILAVLLDNALQYAPENTTVTLGAKAKKGRVSVAVADRGRGVPDEEKARVFERFYRADKSRHDKAHFGLGLSVARELAELHRGKLTVEDTEDGGATFTLTLPVA